MSYTVLKLIPSDPTYVPSDAAAKAIADRVKREFPAAQEVSVETHDETVFVDPGANFESVRCSACQKDIDMDWWQDAMDGGHRVVTVPCCGKELPLNDLIYDMPAGFARWVLEVRDPVGTLPARTVADIGTLLGAPVRQILARY